MLVMQGNGCSTDRQQRRRVERGERGLHLLQGPRTLVFYCSKIDLRGRLPACQAPGGESCGRTMAAPSRQQLLLAGLCVVIGMTYFRDMQEASAPVNSAPNEAIEDATPHGLDEVAAHSLDGTPFHRVVVQFCTACMCFPVHCLFPAFTSRRPVLRSQDSTARTFSN